MMSVTDSHIEVIRLSSKPLKSYLLGDAKSQLRRLAIQIVERVRARHHPRRSARVVCTHQPVVELFARTKKVAPVNHRG